MSEWRSRYLGDLLQPTEQRDPREYPSTSFMYVDIASVDNESKKIVASEPIAGAAAPSRARKVIRKDDVIVSTVRPNLNAVARVPKSLDGEICSTGFSVLRPSEELLSGYLFGFVRSPKFIETLVSMTKGASYPAVSDRDIKGLSIPVPPLAEQGRIVKLLDEADAIRKLRAQADQRTADLIPALFHEMFGGLSNTCRLDELAEIVSGVTKGRNLNGQDVQEVPYLRVANVQSGYLNLSELKTIPATRTEIDRLELKRGDVLMTEGGDFDKLGRGAMWELDLANCIHQNHVFRVRTDRALMEPAFFAGYLQTVAAKRYFLSSAKRTTNLASINMTQLRALPVMVPSLKMQQEFTRQVGVIQDLRARQGDNNQLSEGLLQATLVRAFGDLL